MPEHDTPEENGPDDLRDDLRDDPGRPAVDQASGRARLWHALVQPSRRQVVVGLLLAMVGFGIVTQVQSNQVDDTYSALREQDLIDVLNGLAGTSQRAETEIARLQRTRSELQSDTSRRRAALEQAQNEADTLNILAGLVPVTGPGIRITITEKDGQIEVATLLDTIEELRTVGAEAMQFNGQVRIVAQSSFTDGIGGISIDGVALESPYVIDVIGDPDVLSGAMTFALGPKAKVKRDGGEIEVQKLSSLDIEAVRTPVQPEFAEPDPGQ